MLVFVGLVLNAQMVLNYNTNLSAGTEIALPLHDNVNVIVDWGDGSLPEPFTTDGPHSHTYSVEGEYTVTITGSLEHYGGPIQGGLNDKLVSVSSWEGLGILSFRNAFQNAENLISVPNSLPSTVTCIGQMFSMADLFNSDISLWDVSNVEEMDGMFYSADAFNQDLSSWNLSNVHNIGGMFELAVSFNQDISAWDVSGVTDMTYAFSEATSFNQDLSLWNVSSVTDMEYMFYGAILFNSDISSWDVSNVVNMYSMFEEASSFNQDLSPWNVISAEYLDYFFDNSGISPANYSKILVSWSQLSLISGANFEANSTHYYSFAEDARQSMVDQGWSISDAGPIDGQMILSYNTNLSGGLEIQLPLYDNVDVLVNWGDGTPGETITTDGNHSHTYASEGVYTVTISGHFSRFGYSGVMPGSDKLLGVSAWEGLGITSLENAFYQATNLESLPTYLPNTVTNLSWMLYGATNYNGDISTWDVRDIDNMSATFYAASSFNQNLGIWDVSSTTNMSDMFTDCPVSIENYSSMLMGWSTQVLQSGVTLNAPLCYYNADAADERQSIIEDFGWAIYDAGLYQLSTITTQDATNILSTSITANGTIEVLGNPQITQHGFCWNQSGDPTVLDNITNEGASSIAGAFTSDISSLDINAMYYIRAYAITQFDTVYGGVLTFTTQCVNHTTTDVVTVCNTYVWRDGLEYTASNNTETFTVIGVAEYGCDSIYTLDLTVNYPELYTDVQVACESYEWIDGFTYTESNNLATHTVAGAGTNGCDSIYTLDLTVNYPELYTDVQVACESYEWIDGFTYTESNNIATHTVAGVGTNGCDSIYTLDLTINSPELYTDVQVACGSYEWIDGFTYTESNNIATHTVAGAGTNGCDSIYTLDLTINEIPETPIISLDGTTLVSSSLEGNQWFLDASEITDAINSTYEIVAEGTYTVQVTIDGCSSEVSEPFVWTGIYSNENGELTICPNPTTDFIKLNAENIKISEIQITDELGRLVENIVIKKISDTEYTMDVNSLDSGIYFMIVSDENLILRIEKFIVK